MWTASISRVPILSSAIRSRAILRDVAPYACNRDGQGAHARRQSESAKFLYCPGANRCPSRPGRATRKLTASPKQADGRRCAAVVWVAHHDLALAAGPVRVAAWLPNGCGRLDSYRVLQSQFADGGAELRTVPHRLHPPGPLPPGPFCTIACRICSNAIAGLV